VVKSAREHLYDLKSLEDFTYRDEYNKDQGINIRHKAKELIEFVQNDERIRDERKKAKANRDKYVGMSNESSIYRDEKSFPKSKSLSDEDNQWKNKTKETNTSQSTQNHSSTVPEAPPIIDLLGDEIDFTSNIQTFQDDEFGQFQEATSPQPSLWPTTFDPFASTNKPSSNEFNLFMTPTQPQQQLNKSNTWSSAQGKLNISLDNLIPHTRGNSQKTSLTLNQLTSPTSPNQKFPPQMK